MKVKPYIIVIILNTSRKHVNYEEDKWTNLTTFKIRIFAIFGIFHISFFKALSINEGETTRGEREWGWTGKGAKRLTGRNDPDSHGTYDVRSRS